MKYFTIALLLIISYHALSQDYYLGFKGGIERTNATSNLKDENNPRTGFSGGICYEYHFNRKFIFGADLLFSQKGYNNSTIFNDPNGNLVGGTGKSKYNYNYLSLPVKGGFKIGKKNYGFLNVGIVPSVLIDARIIVPDRTIIFDSGSNVSRFDFSGLVEVGANYEISNRIILFTSLVFQQSITPVSNEEYFDDEEITLFGMVLSIGLKYKLNKY